MTVRWKPILILSGLFLVIGMLGLLAIIYTLNKGSDELVAQARAQIEAGQYDNAEIHLKSALQREPGNAEAHLEMARLYREWAKSGSVEKREERIALERDALSKAVSHEAGLEELKRIETRRRLLAIAAERAEESEAIRWASDLVKIESQNPDAALVLCQETLRKDSKNAKKMESLLKVVEAAYKDAPRTLLLKYEVLRALQKNEEADALLAKVRTTPDPKTIDLLNAIALTKLRTLDISTIDDKAEPKVMASQAFDRIGRLIGAAKLAAQADSMSPPQLNQFLNVCGKAQNVLDYCSGRAGESVKAQVKALADQIDVVAAESIKKAESVSETTDIRIEQVHANYLLQRLQREKCLEVVDRALKSDVAANPRAANVILALKDIAIKAALADPEDPKRFDRVSKHVQDLIASDIGYYQGMGNLYRGAIDLERSGLDTGEAVDGADESGQLRNKALESLKVAAARLPDFSTAQALYGIALIMAKEQTLGRQYLIRASELGSLEPRYRLWAAWSMIQAGYPEEAKPIGDGLIKALDEKLLPESYRPSLLMLMGEIAQRGAVGGGKEGAEKENLEKALEYYKAAIKAGQTPSPALRLRAAQLLILVGDYDQGMKLLGNLRESGQGGPAAENLFVRTMIDRDQFAQARTALNQSRQKFPANSDLALLDATLHIRDKKPEQALKVLDTFRTKHPNDVRIIQEQARLLAEDLNRLNDAMSLLSSVANQGINNSAPLTQLAMFQLVAKDVKGAEDTARRIRQNWPDASTADVIQSQIALLKGDTPLARQFLGDAIRKDPANKLLQFWMAEMDAANGSVDQSIQALERLSKNNSSKELKSGLTLDNAIESNLVERQIQVGQVDEAIARINDLLNNSGSSEFSRRVNWQLVGAYASKGDWAQAKKQISVILNDTKTPVTVEDLVKAANYYRVYEKVKESALNLADQALKRAPNHPQASAIKAVVLNGMGKPEEAAKTIRSVLDAKKDVSPSLNLLYAAFQNIIEPKATQGERAMNALDEGLVVHPDNLSLIESKYRLLLSKWSKDKAFEYLQGLAKKDPDGRYRRLLVDAYREHKQYDDAVKLVNGLVETDPENKTLALARIELLANQAFQAKDQATADRLYDQTMELIRQYRDKHPKSPEFVAAQCEMLARKGKFSDAIELSRQIDQLDKVTGNGPLIRLQLAITSGNGDEAVKAIDVALSRDPRNATLYYRLGQLNLAQGEPEKAILQADKILGISAENPAGLMLKAQGLISQSVQKASVDRIVKANQAEAVKILTQLIQTRPRMIESHQRLSDLYILQGRKAEAVAILKQALEAVPNEEATISQLIHRLVENQDGKPASQADLDAARDLAQKVVSKDKTGSAALAVSIGYGRARKLDPAIYWAEKAVQASKLPVVLLNYGSLLLSKGELDPKAAASQTHFRKAVEQYDQVLALDANSIEAVNNKAWILHRYLKEDAKALELVNGLRQRIGADAFPPEFYDTAGAIQEASGQTREAEKTYQAGLAKAPNDPVLNFHLAKLISTDPSRADAALGYLRKAEEGASRLRADMIKEMADIKNRLAKN